MLPAQPRHQASLYNDIDAVEQERRKQEREEEEKRMSEQRAAEDARRKGEEVCKVIQILQLNIAINTVFLRVC